MSVCINVEHDGAAEVYSQVLRRARKEHDCGECADTIMPGDLYEHFSGLWEHGWETHKTCARCVNVRNDYFDSWIFTMLGEDFLEAHGFDYRDGIPADFAPCKGADS